MSTQELSALVRADSVMTCCGHSQTPGYYSDVAGVSQRDSEARDEAWLTPDDGKPGAIAHLMQTTLTLKDYRRASEKCDLVFGFDSMAAMGTPNDTSCAIKGLLGISFRRSKYGCRGVWAAEMVPRVLYKLDALRLHS